MFFFSFVVASSSFHAYRTSKNIYPCLSKFPKITCLVQRQFLFICYIPLEHKFLYGSRNLVTSKSRIELARKVFNKSKWIEIYASISPQSKTLHFLYKNIRKYISFISYKTKLFLVMNKIDILWKCLDSMWESLKKKRKVLWCGMRLNTQGGNTLMESPWAIYSLTLSSAWEWTPGCPWVLNWSRSPKRCCVMVTKLTTDWYMYAKMTVNDENCTLVILLIITVSFKAQKGKWLSEGNW